MDIDSLGGKSRKKKKKKTDVVEAVPDDQVTGVKRKVARKLRKKVKKNRAESDAEGTTEPWKRNALELLEKCAAREVDSETEVCETEDENPAAQKRKLKKKKRRTSKQEDASAESRIKRKKSQSNTSVSPMLPQAVDQTKTGRVPKARKTGAAGRAAANSTVSADEAAAKDNESSEDSFFAADGEQKGSLIQEPAPEKISDEFKVFVGDLPWAVSEDLVRAHFARYGGVDRFDMPKNREGKPDGQAFIYYKTKQAVENALEMDGCDFHGRQIKVKRAKPQNKKKIDGTEHEAERKIKDKLTVFVGGLPFNTDIEALKNDFSECGVIESIRTLKDEQGVFKGTAFIVFKEEVAVFRALEWHNAEYGGRWIIVRRASNGKGVGKGDSKDRGKHMGKSGGVRDGQRPARNHDHDRTVFVGSLPADVEVRHLQNDFGECGEIESIRVLKGKDGQFNGAAFIVFKTQAGSKQALEWDGEYYGDRKIKVAMARSKD